MDMSEVLAVHLSLSCDRESVPLHGPGRMSNATISEEFCDPTPGGMPVPPFVGVDNSIDVSEALDETVLFAGTCAAKLRETSTSVRVIRPPRPAFCMYAMADKIRREFVANRIRSNGDWK